MVAVERRRPQSAIIISLLPAIGAAFLLADVSRAISPEELEKIEAAARRDRALRRHVYR